MTLTLADLCDDAALLSFETQLHLAEVIGDRPWDVDLGAGRFVFGGGTGEHTEELVCTRVHLLGSAAPGPRSWLWSWATSQGWSDDVTDLARWLRGFGQQQGVRELVEPEVGFADVPGADDPLVAGAVLMDAAKAAAGRWAGYSGPVGGGTRAAFLLEHPSFVLPAPEGVRVVRVLSEGLMAAPLLTDHRRAVAAYAAARPLASRWSPDGTEVELSLPGAVVTVRFDELGRVGGIASTLG